MRLLKISTCALALACLTFSVPAQAGPQGKSGASGAPKTHGPSTHATGSQKGAPKTTGVTKVKGGPTAKTFTPGSTKKTAKVETKSATSKKTAGTTTTSGTSTSPATTTAIDFTSGKVGQLLTKNSALRSKLETRLQALGYTGTVYQAAYGFKNLGQAVATINVAQNLGVPYEQLKLSMTGLSVDAAGTVLKANLNPDGTVTLVDPALATNPAPTKSLGQSIQTAKAGVNATAVAQTATTQADAEISGRR